MKIITQSMDIFFLIGVSGMAMILVAFSLVQSQKVDVNNVWYDLLNFVGSVFLIIYAVPPMSWPFIILNGVWALMSLKDLIFFVTHRRKKLTPKDRFVLWLHNLRK